MLFNKKSESKSARALLADHKPPSPFPPPVTAPEAPAPFTPPLRVPGTAAQTVIDAWLTITGNLQSEGDVQIDGQLCGDVHCAHLVVGRDATITGDVVAEEAVVRGRVKGTIRANRVVLQDTARVESDIFYKTLSIDEGASFDGQSRHTQEPLQDEEATSRAVERLQSKVAEGERKMGAGNGAGLGAASSAG